MNGLKSQQKIMSKANKNENVSAKANNTLAFLDNLFTPKAFNSFFL